MKSWNFVAKNFWFHRYQNPLIAERKEDLERKEKEKKRKRKEGSTNYLVTGLANVLIRVENNYDSPALIRLPVFPVKIEQRLKRSGVMISLVEE